MKWLVVIFINMLCSSCFREASKKFFNGIAIKEGGVGLAVVLREKNLCFSTAEVPTAIKLEVKALMALP